MSELVDWRNQGEEGSEQRGYNNTDNAAPEEKHSNAMLGDVTLSPSNLGVHDVPENGGDDIGDDGIEPKEVVGVHDDTSKESVNNKVE